MTPDWARQALLDGVVIPAHPLALDNARRVDWRRQRALTRYYHAAGASGVAVGVHTTQFAIRDVEDGLFASVLELAATTIHELDSSTGRQSLLVAGVCGRTEQAIGEAGLARGLGYHAGLLSLAALSDATDDELVAHAERVAREIPLVGFYLQPDVGGRVLSRSFWRRFAAIPNVVAIKIAPFNRYRTLDVLRGVAESGRASEIALLTGNDDAIVADLLTEFETVVDRSATRLSVVGGLLGQWAVWTRRAVELHGDCRRAALDGVIPARLLTVGSQLTDANAAIFDAANAFRGCIPGIHEVLRRQGLLETTYCLDPHERLSPGQQEEIDRVARIYPHLTDDDFVRERLEEWLE